MKVVIINQARMTSTRLPGKVLKEVLGKPLLEYQVERLRRVELANKIVIATTINVTDQPIVDLCKRLEIPYYRGSEDDVLSRYYEAAEIHQADIVLRVTSDCPLIDPEIVDQAIRLYLDHQEEYDYVSTDLVPSYPRGMDVEVFPFRVLKQAFCEAGTQLEREHVTPFIHRKPERYNLANLACDSDVSKYRLTVDTQEDFALIKAVIEDLYPVNSQFNLCDIINLIKDKPGLFELNTHVKQKVQ